MKRDGNLTIGALIMLSAAACQPGADASNGGSRTAVAGEVVTLEGEAGLPVCELIPGEVTLPDDVRETSGLAQGRRNPSIFWTHNDAGGEPNLYALNAEGGLVGPVRISGAQLQDWEDIAAGPCESGECLFIADTGDNDGERELVTIYEVQEPDATSSESATAIAINARFPDGRWDAEGLFILPGGEIYLVTKGRRGPVALYRVPADRGGGGTVVLERVRELFPEAAENDDRVTGASASPDGRWVGIRTYRTLYLYPAAAFVGRGPVEAREVDLRPLGQSQGESLAIGSDGTIWLTSEAGGGDGRPSWSRIRCDFSRS